MMPLVNQATHLNPSGFNASQYQKQKERKQHNEKNDVVGPSQKPVSSRPVLETAIANGEPTFNPIDAKDIITPQNEKNRRALGLKMDVPDSLEMRPKASITKVASQRNNQGVGKAQNEGHMSQAKFGRHEPPPTAFDDTTSFNIDDDESSLQENENPTIVYRGSSPRPLQIRLQKNSHLQHRQSTFDDTEFPKDLSVYLGENWQDEVREELRYQRRETNPYGEGHERSMEGYEDLDHFEQYGKSQGQNQTAADTPSRARTAPPLRDVRSAPMTKVVSFNSPSGRSEIMARDDSPELGFSGNKLAPEPFPGVPQNGPRDDTMMNKKTPQVTDMEHNGARRSFTRLLPTNQVLKDVVKHSNPGGTFESSRASDYPTSSEDEIPPPQSRAPSPKPSIQNKQVSRKRCREDALDYDLATIKTMKYGDLFGEKFDKDPQDSTQDVVFDSQGNVMTLPQRMNNLGKMSDEEQKTMFRKQDDNEWAQTGSWFITKFQDDLKRLMAVRVERRRISIKFENEIHQRQKDLEWHSAGISEELTELKRGGGALIQGKEVPSRRGTPQKK